MHHNTEKRVSIMKVALGSNEPLEMESDEPPILNEYQYGIHYNAYVWSASSNW